jgi:hypothetical protein
MVDHGVTATADVVATLLVGAGLVWLVARALTRRRRDLDLRLPLLTAYGIRIAAAAILGLTSLNGSIRGIDEQGFIADSRALAHLPFSSHEWLAALTGYLHIDGVYNAGTFHIFLMGGQIKFFGFTELSLRASMAALSVIGMGLVAAAVHELAGSRPSKLACWLLAIEPANIFFSTALHKEPLLYLAVGMASFGAALFWTRPRFIAFPLMVAGALIATATATYVGWFLAAGCVAVVVHAVARRLSRRARWLVALGTVVICASAIVVPSVAQRVHSELVSLQQSQNKNAKLHSKLGLEPVDFSTPGQVAINLPRRMFDLMFRPYPWQLSDTSQRVAVIETVFVLAMLIVLAQTIVIRRRSFFALAAPLAYPALTLWFAYALAVANAGTGFRYRTQIIPLMIGMIFTLRPDAPTLVPARFRSASGDGPVLNGAEKASAARP